MEQATGILHVNMTTFNGPQVLTCKGKANLITKKYFFSRDAITLKLGFLFFILCYRERRFLPLEVR